MQQQYLSRAQRHKHLIRAIGQGAASVTLHATDNEDFTILDIYAKDPRRLDKKPKDVIGKPTTFLSSQISEPRICAMKKAVATGQEQIFNYYYDDLDNQLHWKFQSAIALLPGTEELICITIDAVGRDWQEQYWMHRFLELPKFS